MTAHNRYFRTDGIRGRVGSDPITPDFFLQLGVALGSTLRERGDARVVIARDTRSSGEMLCAALTAGLCSAGVDALELGCLPTPAVPYFVTQEHAAAGLMVTASHNPYTDNGVKVFDSRGRKLSLREERVLERALASAARPAPATRAGSVTRARRTVQYVSRCLASVPSDLSLAGLSLVVDGANGAYHEIAPLVLETLGATVERMACAPNGTNINQRCGATDTAALSRRVVANGADLGLAFDGDGDRVIVVDADGARFDGDDLLYALARARHRRGELRGGVVGTIESNEGLARSLAALRIPFTRARVGDRNVELALRVRGWSIGGEPCGHTLLREHGSSGDGLIAALQLLAELTRARAPLASLREGFARYEQARHNFRLDGAHDPLTRPAFRRALRAVQDELGARGRIVVRPSGTEPVLRVMIESARPGRADTLLRELVAAASEPLARPIPLLRVQDRVEQPHQLHERARQGVVRSTAA